MGGCKDLPASFCVPQQMLGPGSALVPSLYPVSKLGRGWWSDRRPVPRGVAGPALAPGRNVQIVRPLEDVEVMEKEGATFSCAKSPMMRCLRSGSGRAQAPA